MMLGVLSVRVMEMVECVYRMECVMSIGMHLHGRELVLYLELEYLHSISRYALITVILVSRCFMRCSLLFLHCQHALFTFKGSYQTS